MRRTLAEIPYTLEIAFLLMINAIALQLQLTCETLDGIERCTSGNPIISFAHARSGLEPRLIALVTGALLILFAAYALGLHLSRAQRESRRNLYLILTPVVVLYGWMILVIAQPPLGPLTTLILALDALRLHYKTISLQAELRYKQHTIDHLCAEEVTHDP